MDHRERYRLLTTGRSGQFRNLVRNMTNDPRDLPTKSELKAELAELYPGEQYAEAREVMFGKLVQIAEARAAGGVDLIELRGIADEYVIKVETELADDDRLIAREDGGDPVDVSSVRDYIDGFDPTQKRLQAITDAAKAAELEGNRARIIGGQS
jgi:hypothetical protein